MKASCEFCRSIHNMADTCDMRVGTQSVNSEEAVNQIRVRDVLEKMEHNRDLVIGIIFREGTGAQVKLLEPDYNSNQIKEMR